MKIAVIGGGSTYTPELVNGFLARADRLLLEEPWLISVTSASTARLLRERTLQNDRARFPQ
jgi:alpha-galactosidase/6-phospho-beta-glucosidase family protein